MTGRKLIAKVSFILFVIIAGILFTGGSVLAQSPQFRLDMDSLNLQKGVSANLVLSMVNAQGAEVKVVNGLESFDVISNSNSSYTQIVNGNKTYEQDVNYVIMPKNEGRFTLQGIVDYNGKEYKTNELQVNVSPSNNTGSGTAQNIFLKTLLSKNEIYLGQKDVLSYELYSRYNIADFGFLDNTSIDDFLASDMPQDKNADIVYLSGNKYAKYEAKQTILSPMKTGAFTIPAYSFQVDVSTGDFFNSSKPFYLQSDSETLTVKPLPQENQPADFSGIVGKLDLESKYSKKEVNYGDSLTLDVTASGDCNLDGLKEIVKDGIPGFSVYQTDKNAKESVENNQYNAEKEFEIILVPQKTGDIKIDPIYISYFNPESGKYEKAEITGTTITVKGEIPQVQAGGTNNTGGTNNSGGTASAGTVKIDQISYDQQNNGYLTIQLKKNYLFAGMIVLIIILIITAFILLLLSYGKKQDKELQDIYRQIKNSDNPNDIYNLFNSMIKHCFNLSLKASSKNMAGSRLAGHELAYPVLEIMDYMENKSHPQRDIVFLKEKIKGIYKQLRKRK